VQCGSLAPKVWSLLITVNAVDIDAFARVAGT
jgi:hypothetical protein